MAKRTDLIKVITDIKQPIESITDLQTRLKTLRKALKDSPREGTAAFNKLANELSSKLGESVNESKKRIRDWSANATKEVRDANDAIKVYNNSLKNIKPPKPVFKETIGSLNELKSQLKQAKKEFANLKEGTDEFTKARLKVDELSFKVKNFGKTVEQIDPNSLEGLRASLKKGEKEFAKINIASTKFASKQADLKKLRDRIFEIEKATGDARRGVGQYERAFGKLGASVNKFAAIAGVGLGLNELVNLAKQGITTFANFEQQVATLGAVSGATAEQLAALREQSIAYGSATQFTATQVSELQTALARLGFSTEEILASTESVGNVAIATGEDIGESAKVIGQSIRAYGLSAEDAGRVSDVLTASFNSSALQLETFAEASKLIAPTARILNVSLEETTSAIGLLADNGLEGTIATQTIGSALQRLADDSGKYAKAAEAVGAEIFNQNGEFVGLNQVIRNITEATKDQTKEQQLATLTSIVGQNAAKNFAILLNGTKEVITETGKETLKGADALDFYTGQLNVSGGAAAATAAKVGDTLAQDFLKLESAIEGATIRLIESRESGLRGFVQGITAAVPAIGRFISEGLGKLQDIFKEIIEPIQVYVTAFSDILKVFGLASKEGQAFSTVLTVLATTTRIAFAPLRIAVTLISAVAAKIAEFLTFGRALITVIGRQSGAFEVLSSWFDSVSEKAGFFSNVIGVVAGVVGKGFENITSSIGKVIGKFDIFTGRLQGIKDFFSDVNSEVDNIRLGAVEVEQGGTGETRAERANRIAAEQREEQEKQANESARKRLEQRGKAQQKVTEAVKDTTEAIKTETEAAAGSISRLSSQVQELERQIQEAPPEIIPNLIPQLNEAKGLLNDAQQALEKLQNPTSSFEASQGQDLASTIERLRLLEAAILESTKVSEEQKKLIQEEFAASRTIAEAETESRILAQRLRLNQLNSQERLALEQELSAQKALIEQAEVERAKVQQEQIQLVNEEALAARIEAIKANSTNEIAALDSIRQKAIENETLTNEQRKSILENYAEQRKEIEQRLEIELLQIRINQLEQGSAERLQLEQELADRTFAIRKGLYDKDVAASAEAEAEKQKLKEQLIQAGFTLATKVADTAFDLNNQRLEAEKEQSLATLDSELQGRLALVEGNSEAESALNAEYERRKIAIEKDANRRKKRAAIIQATINTALAIGNALATTPFPASLITAALAAATGAAQVAVISAQKFAKGGQFNPNQHKKGGYLKRGALHSQNNGMPIIDPSTGRTEAYIEKNEAIVSRKAMLSNKTVSLEGRPIDIISHINSRIGKGVSYAGARPVRDYGKRPKFAKGTVSFGVSKRVRKLQQGAVVASAQARQIEGFDNSKLDELIKLTAIQIQSNEANLAVINESISNQKSTAAELREVSKMINDQNIASE